MAPVAAATHSHCLYSAVHTCVFPTSRIKMHRTTQVRDSLVGHSHAKGTSYEFLLKPPTISLPTPHHSTVFTQSCFCTHHHHPPSPTCFLRYLPIAPSHPQGTHSFYYRIFTVQCCTCRFAVDHIRVATQSPQPHVLHSFIKPHLLPIASRQSPSSTQTLYCCL